MYFSAGVVIGLMALPTVVTVAEDALSTVPESIKSGSLAMGSTQWQTTKSVTLPAGLSGSPRASCSASAARWARRWRRR